jgi:hypothetical protein
MSVAQALQEQKFTEGGAFALEQPLEIARGQAGMRRYAAD